jgi:hypothetical protein
MMKMNKFWLKSAIVIYCSILILIGFALGYIYNNYKNESCVERPLFYGIEMVDKLNNDSFTCSCSSLSKEVNPFHFNKDGIVADPFLDPVIDTIIINNS